MEQIKKNYDVGTLKINARYIDGAVFLTTSNTLTTKQIYYLAKKQGRDVKYIERLQCCVEYFKDKKAEEIMEEIERQNKEIINKVIKEKIKR